MSVKIYETLDNGGRPFRVEVSKNKVKVLVQEYSDTDEVTIYNECPLVIENPAKVWIGDEGSSILVQTKTRNKFIFIGDSVFTVEIDDVVIDYSSPIGNSAVPYPYAIGKKNVYLMIGANSKVEKKIRYDAKIIVYIPRDLLAQSGLSDNDGYDFLWQTMTKKKQITFEEQHYLIKKEIISRQF